MENYDTVFKSVGMDALAYSPPSATLLPSQWPTLGELITSGKPLVAFLTTSTNFTTVPYLIDGETLIYVHKQQSSHIVFRIPQYVGDSV